MKEEWVLRAVDRPANRAYVKLPGQDRSYGTKATARRFASREDAQAEACGNETPERITDSRET